VSLSHQIEELCDRLDAEPLHPIWISRTPREILRERSRQLENTAGLPLCGIPFAVKDNIDVAGAPTTAGCPAYSYVPSVSAPVVQVLEKAGAILIGKTNMDQFATGLVGTRSPYGACSSVFDARYISGGSSSGSAVAVAKGFAGFSLGTDTAGSGRVPAAFNNLIGVKPTRGWLSTRGVVPACRTLDCVSIFAKSCRAALAVLRVARAFDGADPYSRAAKAGEEAAPWWGGSFRFGVPAQSELRFFGDQQAEELYHRALARLEEIGGQRVEIDYSIFRRAADLLYSGPWVAERFAAIQGFFTHHADEMNPVVRQIISKSQNFSAADAFKSQYALQDFRRGAESQWRSMDVLVLPTTGTIFTHEEIQAEPINRNTDLGYYTNFVNLMDLAAVATPGGFRGNGLPFGVSFIGPAHSDEALLALADRFLGATEPLLSTHPGCVNIAVVGAHLSGQPLNWQLSERGARLVRTCRTAPGYRLYALAGAHPPKPGLVRDPAFSGPGIEVEVWAMPEDQVGSFLALIPAPLGLGSANLADGESVKCFLCEPYAIASATEITRFGGWRAYLESLPVV
jgi:allophanate hydrolase